MMWKEGKSKNCIFNQNNSWSSIGKNCHYTYLQRTGKYC